MHRRLRIFIPFLPLKLIWLFVEVNTMKENFDRFKLIAVFQISQQDGNEKWWL